MSEIEKAKTLMKGGSPLVSALRGGGKREKGKRTGRPLELKVLIITHPEGGKHSFGIEGGPGRRGRAIGQMGERKVH